MSYYRFFPFRDDYHRGRHHDEGIVNNLIVNVQEQYIPRCYHHEHFHPPYFGGGSGGVMGGVSGVPGVGGTIGGMVGGSSGQ